MDRSDGRVLYSLQIGRALAAIGVLVHHAAIATASAYPAMPEAVLRVFGLGRFGVDYFFVLSGFIIAHTTRNLGKDSSGAKHYAIARFLRVYTPYLPISLAMVAAFLLVPSLSMGDGAAHSYVLASVLLLPSDGAPALSVAWTLQHEVVFYLLFGLCLFVFKRPKLIFLWAVPMLCLPLLAPRTSNIANITVSMLNGEFLFGVAACYLYHNGKLFAWRKPLVAAGIAVVLAAFVFLSDPKQPFTYSPLVMGLGYGCTVLGFAYMERASDFGRFRRMVYLGSVSYSLYLIHGPAISLLLRKLPGLYPSWGIAFAVFTVLGGCAGIAYFHLVEKPLMRFAKKRFGFRHVAMATA